MILHHILQENESECQKRGWRDRRNGGKIPEELTRYNFLLGRSKRKEKKRKATGQKIGNQWVPGYRKEWILSNK